MTKPEILPAHVRAFARIARKVIEQRMGVKEQDRPAFWAAVRRAYAAVPTLCEASSILVPLEVTVDDTDTRWMTVADWSEHGYRGLRILRCIDCRASTYRTWADLGVMPDQNVVEVARHVRCHGCGRAPAGLAMPTRQGV